MYRCTGVHKAYLAKPTLHHSHKETIMKEILVVLLLLHRTQVWSMNNLCLKSVEIVERAASEAQLSWAYSCTKDSLIKFKIYFSHQRFLACDDPSKDESKPSGVGHEEVTDSRVILHNLHANSEYEVKVVAVQVDNKPEEVTILVRTRPGLPKVVARQGVGEYRGNNTAVFTWDKPGDQCQLYNSHLGGWEYQVVRMEDNKKEVIMTGNLPLSQTQLQVDNLTPYTQYMLLLFTTNQEGKYDQNVVLKIPLTATQSGPAPPSTTSTPTQPSSSTPSYVFIVLGVLPLLCVVVLIIFIKYRHRQATDIKNRHSQATDIKKDKHHSCQDPELLTPIIKNPNCLTLPAQSSTGSGSPRLFTTLTTHRPPRSPLPPLPARDDPIYEAIDSNEAEVAADDDGYLAPNTLRVESLESLDDEGYLRPNFVPVGS